MNLNDIRQTATNLLIENGLSAWSFSFNNNKRRVAVCKHGDQRIEISQVFTPHMTDAQILNSLTHEIAHALMGPGYGHSASWQARHIMLGGDGKRCAGLNQPVDSYKWVIVCAVDRRELGRVNRRGARLDKSLCRCHRAALSWVELR